MNLNWLWVIIGMIFVSVVIGLIFLLINWCISREGKLMIHQLERGSTFETKSNSYQERNVVAVIPPLPSRAQFDTAETQSNGIQDYESIADDYEQSMGEQPDYLNVQDDDADIIPPTPSEAQSYIDLNEGENYVMMEDKNQDADNTSDYDDVGCEDQDEDYDDVG
ncbi:uncharacterized protein scimp [Pholidichthys leucotaenia]